MKDENIKPKEDKKPEELKEFPWVTKQFPGSLYGIAGKSTNTYDHINPSHYKKYSHEVIDMMIKIYGKEATAIYCEMNAFKYTMRVGMNPDQPIERDIEKRDWYLNKAAELRR